MVKGISRQVIVVDAPEPKLFDQAIFILREGALNQEGVTDEALLKEARQILRSHERAGGKGMAVPGPVWACGGAGITGLVWLLSCFL